MLDSGPNNLADLCHTALNIINAEQGAVCSNAFFANLLAQRRNDRPSPGMARRFVTNPK